MNYQVNHHKATLGGILITFGIIFGDIGTSPLYVMQAIVGGQVISKDLILGSLSLIFWTLTLQTTVKYVVIVLRADNKGEGGILALYALIRRKAKWLTIPAIIGAATLLADGIITPPISVSSAIEGLQIVYPNIETIPIVLIIITLLFLIQGLGTNVVGKAFGPIMLVWFSMLFILGLNQILKDVSILAAFNPIYAINLLRFNDNAFWLLGSVFLCTTGAEALYSDLGHCGRMNIFYSWGIVKVCLVVNYFGQGAWLLSHLGEHLTASNGKPFFEIIPDWFLLPGIIISTFATVIASQALITGSYTLISEAIRLGFWPKVRSLYPTDKKGQLYIPSVNWFLYLGCIAIILYFKKSSNMEAAYGLAITLTMLMTTILMTYYLYVKKVKVWWLVIFVAFYSVIETGFFWANVLKFFHGGWVSLLLALCIAYLMTVWFRSKRIRTKHIDFVKLERFLPVLKDLSQDESVARYATHLIFLSNANRISDIESKVMYSILEKRPKRADMYWFIHVDITDEPYTLSYKVDEVEPDYVFKINFKLGFRVEQRVDLYFRQVLHDLENSNEINILSRYKSLEKHHITGDFRFVVLERYLSNENKFSFFDKVVMETYFFIKQFTTPEDKWFGLEASNVKVEKVPLIIKEDKSFKLSRI
jgi:KUP system potassium uptake protein